MQYVLEKYRFFPYVAWTLVIGFVFFTYSLTVRLSETTNAINEYQQQNTASTESSRL